MITSIVCAAIVVIAYNRGVRANGIRAIVRSA